MSSILLFFLHFLFKGMQQQQENTGAVALDRCPRDHCEFGALVTRNALSDDVFFLFLMQ